MPQIAHGYPDFGRVIAQSDVLFNYENNTAYVGQTLRTLGFVGHLPFLGIKFRSQGGAQRLRISFYADAGLTQVLSQYVVDVGAGGFYAGSIPIQGPFCSLRIINGIGVAAFDLAVWSNPAEFTGDDNNSDDSILASVLGQNIAAGATFTINCPRTRPGLAYWSASSILATYDATISGVAFDTTTFYIQKIDQGQPRHNELIVLPPMQIRIDLHNGTGAAGPMNTALIARPWSPGH